MVYDMRINKKFLDLVKKGVKKREYRLNTPYRDKIKIDDTIRLINDNDEKDFIFVRVINRETYPNFNEALRSYYFQDFQGLYNSFEECVDECNKFYEKEEIDKYGIVVFRIGLY